LVENEKRKRRREFFRNIPLFVGSIHHIFVLQLEHKNLKEACQKFDEVKIKPSFVQRWIPIWLDNRCGNTYKSIAKLKNRVSVSYRNISSTNGGRATGWHSTSLSSIVKLVNPGVCVIGILSKAG
jgi:hypothetical protein